MPYAPFLIQQLLRGILRASPGHLQASVELNTILNESLKKEYHALLAIYGGTFMRLHKNPPNEVTLLTLFLHYMTLMIGSENALFSLKPDEKIGLQRLLPVLEQWLQDSIEVQSIAALSDGKFQKIQAYAIRLHERFNKQSDFLIIPSGFSRVNMWSSGAYLSPDSKEHYAGPSASAAIIQRDPQNAAYFQWTQIDPFSPYHQTVRTLTKTKRSVALEMQSILLKNITPLLLEELITLKVIAPTEPNCYRPEHLYETILARLEGITHFKDKADHLFKTSRENSFCSSWYAVKDVFYYLLTQCFEPLAARDLYKKMICGFQTDLLNRVSEAYQQIDLNSEQNQQYSYLLHEMCAKVAANGVKLDSIKRKILLDNIEKTQAIMKEREASILNHRSQTRTFQDIYQGAPHFKTNTSSKKIEAFRNHQFIINQINRSVTTTETLPTGFVFPVFDYSENTDDTRNAYEKLEYLHSRIDAFLKTPNLTYRLNYTYQIALAIETAILSLCHKGITEWFDGNAESMDQVATWLLKMGQLYYSAACRIASEPQNTPSDYNPVHYGKLLVITHSIYAMLDVLARKNESISEVLKDYQLNTTLNDKLSFNSLWKELILPDRTWVRVLGELKRYFDQQEKHTPPLPPLFNHGAISNAHYKITFRLNADEHDNNVKCALMLLKKDPIAYEKFQQDFQTLPIEKRSRQWAALFFGKASTHEEYLPTLFTCLRDMAYYAQVSLRGVTEQQINIIKAQVRRPPDSEKRYFSPAVRHWSQNSEEVYASHSLYSASNNLQIAFLQHQPTHYVFPKEKTAFQKLLYPDFPPLENHYIAHYHSRPESLSPSQYLTLSFIRTNLHLKPSRLYLALKNSALSLDSEEYVYLMKQALLEVADITWNSGDNEDHHTRPLSFLERRFKHHQFADTFVALFIDLATQAKERLSQYRILGHMMDILVYLHSFSPDFIQTKINVCFSAIRTSLIAKIKNETSQEQKGILSAYVIITYQTQSALTDEDIHQILNARESVEKNVNALIQLPSELYAVMMRTLLSKRTLIEKTLQITSSLYQNGNGIIDIMRGRRYVNNVRVGGLAKSIIEHADFRAAFDNVFLLYDPGTYIINQKKCVQYTSSTPYEKNNHTFSRRITLLDSSNTKLWLEEQQDEDEYQTFVPRHFLVDILPKGLIEKYTHWCHHDQMDIKDAARETKFRLNLINGALYSIKPDGEPDQCLIPFHYHPTGIANRKFWEILTTFEDAHHILILGSTLEMTNEALSATSIVLPRFSLSFTIQGQDIISNDYKDYRLAPCQQIETLLGISNYWVIESMTNTQRKVIIGHRHASNENTPFYNTAFTLDLVSQPHSPAYFTYTIDKTLGTLRAETTPGKLYLAWLFFKTASLAPDPLTQLNGYEMASELLKTCWQNVTYDTLELDIILRFFFVNNDKLKNIHEKRKNEKNWKPNEKEIIGLLDESVVLRKEQHRNAIAILLRVLFLMNESLETHFLHKKDTMVHLNRTTDHERRFYLKTYGVRFFLYYLNVKNRVHEKCLLSLEEERKFLRACRVICDKENWPQALETYLEHLKTIIQPSGTTEQNLPFTLTQEDILPEPVFSAVALPIFDMTAWFSCTENTPENRAFPFDLTTIAEPVVFAEGFGHSFMEELQSSYNSFLLTSERKYQLLPSRTMNELEVFVNSAVLELQELAATIWRELHLELIKIPKTSHGLTFALSRQAGQRSFYTKSDRLRVLINPEHAIEDLKVLFHENPFLQKYSTVIAHQLHQYIKIEIQRVQLETTLDLITQYKNLSAQEPDEKNNLEQEIAKHLASKNNSADTKDSAELLFEFENKVTIRDSHRRLIQAMVESIKDKEKDPSKLGQLFQLDMREEKNSIILILLVQVLADGNRLTRVNILAPLMGMMKDLLSLKLGGLLQKRVYQMPFSRDVDSSPVNLQKMHEMLEECRKHRHILLMTPEQRLCLQLTYRETLLQYLATREPKDILYLDKQLERFPLRYFETALTQNELQQRLELLTKIEKNNFCDVFNDADEIFGAENELSYVMGDSIKLEGDEFRWIIPSMLLSILFFDSEIKAILLQNTNSVVWKEEQLRFTHKMDSLLKRKLAEKLLAKVAEEYGLVYSSFSNKLKDGNKSIGYSCLDFILGKMAETSIEKKFLSLFGKEHNNVIESIVLLIKAWLSHDILNHVMSRRYRVEFGLDAEPGELPHNEIAIPFKGQDNPSARSEFSHPDVMIGLTILSYYYQGLHVDQLKKALLALKQHAKRDEQLEQWYQGNITSELPDYLSSFTTLDLESPEHLAAITYFLSKNTKAIHYYLNNIVFPEKAKYYKEKITGNAHTLAGASNTTGFSGTDDRKDTLPATVESKALEVYTNGKMVHLMTRASNRTYHSIQSSTVKEFLNEVADYTKKALCYALIDAGAMTAGMNNHQVARYLLKNIHSRFQGVVFFDDLTGRILVLMDNDKVMSLAICHLDKSVLFVYFDEVHTRGSDLKLPLTAHGIVTLCRGMNKDKLMQAIMRLRQLEYKQSVCFWGPAEVSAQIVSFTNVHELNNITSNEVLAWVAYNTIQKVSADLYPVTLQKLEYVIKRRALLYQEANLNQPITALIGRFVDSSVDELEKNYGSTPVVKKGVNNILQVKSNTLQPNLKTALDNELNERELLFLSNEEPVPSNFTIGLIIRTKISGVTLSSFDNSQLNKENALLILPSFQNEFEEKCEEIREEIRDKMYVNQRIVRISEKDFIDFVQYAGKQKHIELKDELKSISFSANLQERRENFNSDEHVMHNILNGLKKKLPKDLSYVRFDLETYEEIIAHLGKTTSMIPPPIKGLFVQTEETWVPITVFNDSDFVNNAQVLNANRTKYPQLLSLNECWSRIHREEEYQNIQWPTNILATRNFIQTVHVNERLKQDDYLRPVDTILVHKKSEITYFILLSGNEANAIQALWNNMPQQQTENLFLVHLDDRSGAMTIPPEKREEAFKTSEDHYARTVIRLFNGESCFEASEEPFLYQALGLVKPSSFIGESIDEETSQRIYDELMRREYLQPNGFFSTELLYALENNMKLKVLSNKFSEYEQDIEKWLYDIQRKSIGGQDTKNTLANLFWKVVISPRRLPSAILKNDIVKIVEDTVPENTNVSITKNTSAVSQEAFSQLAYDVAQLKVSQNELCEKQRAFQKTQEAFEKLRFEWEIQQIANAQKSETHAINAEEQEKAQQERAALLTLYSKLTREKQAIQTQLADHQKAINHQAGGVKLSSEKVMALQQMLMEQEEKETRLLEHRLIMDNPRYAIYYDTFKQVFLALVAAAFAGTTKYIPLTAGIAATRFSWVTSFVSNIFPESSVLTTPLTLIFSYYDNDKRFKALSTVRSFSGSLTQGEILSQDLACYCIRAYARDTEFHSKTVFSKEQAEKDCQYLMHVIKEQYAKNNKAIDAQDDIAYTLFLMLWMSKNRSAPNVLEPLVLISEQSTNLVSSHSLEQEGTNTHFSASAENLTGASNVSVVAGNTIIPNTSNAISSELTEMRALMAMLMAKQEEQATEIQTLKQELQDNRQEQTQQIHRLKNVLQETQEQIQNLHLLLKQHKQELLDQQQEALVQEKMRLDQEKQQLEEKQSALQQQLLDQKGENSLETLKLKQAIELQQINFTEQQAHLIQQQKVLDIQQNALNIQSDHLEQHKTILDTQTQALSNINDREAVNNTVVANLTNTLDSVKKEMLKLKKQLSQEITADGGGLASAQLPSSSRNGGIGNEALLSLQQQLLALDKRVEDVSVECQKVQEFTGMTETVSSAHIMQQRIKNPLVFLQEKLKQVVVAQNKSYVLSSLYQQPYKSDTNDLKAILNDVRKQEAHALCSALFFHMDDKKDIVLKITSPTLQLAKFLYEEAHTVPDLLNILNQLKLNMGTLMPHFVESNNLPFSNEELSKNGVLSKQLVNLVSQALNKWHVQLNPNHTNQLNLGGKI